SAVVVADGEHRVSLRATIRASSPLTRLRQGNIPRALDRLGEQTLVGGEPEDEGESFRQAALQLGQVLRHTAVEDRLKFQRVGVALWRRPLRELGDIVGPFRLAADALPCNTVDAVADLRAAILQDRPFRGTLIVVNEQARGNEGTLVLLLAIELHRTGDG